MAIIAAASGIQEAEVNTEHSLTQQTSIGIYVLLVDTSALEAGDSVTLRIKTTRSSGDTNRLAYSYVFTGVQDEPNKYSVPVPVDVEIICTLEQTTGSSRNFPWKLIRA